MLGETPQKMHVWAETFLSQVARDGAASKKHLFSRLTDPDKAIYSNSLNPRVVCADFGWWFPEEGNYELCRGKESIINSRLDGQFVDRPE